MNISSDVGAAMVIGRSFRKLEIAPDIIPPPLSLHQPGAIVHLIEAGLNVLNRSFASCTMIDRIFLSIAANGGNSFANACRIWRTSAEIDNLSYSLQMNGGSGCGTRYQSGCATAPL